MKVVVFLADGFEECEALIVVDILRRANIYTIMASVTGEYNVASSRHIIVKADTLAENVDYDNTDLIVLPGGRVGTENLKKSELIKEKCQEFSKNKMIAAICAAPSILAEFGILESKEATCHPDYEAKMCGAILKHDSIVISDNIVTGQGLGVTFEFAFKLVEKLVGDAVVNNIKTAICYK